MTTDLFVYAVCWLLLTGVVVHLVAAICLAIAVYRALIWAARRTADINRRCPTCRRTFEDCRCTSPAPRGEYKGTHRA
ncbi:MAG TPA: hypothetical protein VFY14_10885 [Streptomyces sp.]|nr:hypothetical protein [Streptomyces sp.]